MVLCNTSLIWVKNAVCLFCRFVSVKIVSVQVSVCACIVHVCVSQYVYMCVIDYCTCVDIVHICVNEHIYIVVCEHCTCLNEHCICLNECGHLPCVNIEWALCMFELTCVNIEWALYVSVCTLMSGTVSELQIPSHLPLLVIKHRIILVKGNSESHSIPLDQQRSLTHFILTRKIWCKHSLTS